MQRQTCRVYSHEPLKEEEDQHLIITEQNKRKMLCEWKIKRINKWNSKKSTQQLSNGGENRVLSGNFLTCVLTCCLWIQVILTISNFSQFNIHTIHIPLFHEEIIEIGLSLSRCHMTLSIVFSMIYNKIK